MNELNTPVPVAEVTVLEDRAHVFRRGLVHFPVGFSRLVVHGVSPLVVDKTLGVSAHGSTRVIRSRVSRVRVNQTLPGLAVSEREVAAAEQSATHEKNTCKMVEDAIARTLEEVAYEVAEGAHDLDRWSSDLATLSDRAQAARLRWAEARARADEQREEFLRHGNEARIHSVIEIDVQCSDAAPHPIQIDYVVPNVRWRPRYIANIVDKSEESCSVSFATEAAIWQNTGEDWADALVTLSTQNVSSRASSPPELGSDVLRKSRRSSVPPMSDITGAHKLSSVEKVERAYVPDDWGKIQAWTSETRQHILSSEEPSFVSLTSFEATCDKPSIAVHPADFEHAIMHAVIRAESSHPLLAGPVDLLRNHAWVGRSSIPFVEEGMEFSLDWIAETGVRGAREEKIRPQTARKKGSGVETARVEILVQNNSGNEREVTVHERGPLLGDRKLPFKFDRVELPEDGKCDGPLRWTLRVPANTKQKITAHYVRS